MNTDERELLEGLHALASDGPGHAPVEVEDRLVAVFRDRFRRRRARAWMAAAAGSLAAAIVVLVWLGLGPFHPLASPPEAIIVDETAAGFYPLPDADGLPPVESGLVVRVQLPTASLELIGYPINQDGAPDPVEAEVLLGQDGLARGVRLVE